MILALVIMFFFSCIAWRTVLNEARCKAIGIFR